nr:hypothetical protein [Nitrosomonas nitrosa]
METKSTRCEGRIEEHLQGRVDDLRKLWKAYCEGKEETEDGNIFEYGLYFDYVAPGTFDDQKEGYFRYQLSWGGPSDEFRFFINPDLSCHRIEYWFLDWFDGAHRALSDESETLLFELWDWLKEGIDPASLASGKGSTR